MHSEEKPRGTSSALPGGGEGASSIRMAGCKRPTYLKYWLARGWGVWGKFKHYPQDPTMRHELPQPGGPGRRAHSDAGPRVLHHARRQRRRQ